MPTRDRPETDSRTHQQALEEALAVVNDTQHALRQMRDALAEAERERNIAQANLISAENAARKALEELAPLLDPATLVAPVKPEKHPAS